MKLSARFSITAVACIAMMASGAAAQGAQHAHGDGGAPAEVGEVAFPNSGAAAAQPHFLRGLALLHSFEYRDAAVAFQEAQRVDPGFALAYWGEAMTYNHPVWLQQDSAAARVVLARLGPTPEARAAKAGTPREREWLAALEVLYGAGRKEARDSAYVRAMRRLHESDPADPEAAAFYALSLLGTAHGGRHVPTYLRAAEVVEAVFRAHPRHPGAAHYLIHAYDDPENARQGLPAARAYSGIAPAAAHAQHMTSHIFVALGMWDDVVAANENALRVTGEAAARAGRPAPACGHYPFWLEYGYLQQGRHREALRMLEACAAAVGRGEAPPVALADMRARYLLDTEEWSGPAVALDGGGRGEAPARLRFEWATAYAELKRGDAAAARPRIERVAELRRQLIAQPTPWTGPAFPRVSGVLEQELRALLALAEGRRDEAVATLQAAAREEAAIPFEFGPPFIDKPASELLGEVLLEAGRPAEARQAFEAALRLAPLRVQSLRGLARAAERSGDRARADQLRAQLREIQQRADAEVAAAGR